MGSPTVEVLSKACQLDPNGGRELLRLTLFETLADLTEIYGDRLDADFAKSIDSSAPTLVRAFISKRLAGEPVDDIIAAAGQISKAHDVSHEKRDARGEWTKDGGRLDKIRAFATDEGNKKQVDDALNKPSGRGYAQMSLAGRALTAAGAAGGQPHAVALGMTAQLAGDLGPEAERILGPSLKRTAYRYRGTERRPSLEEQTEVHDLAEATMALNSGKELSPRLQHKMGIWNEDLKASRSTRPDRGQRHVSSPTGILDYWQSQGGSPDQKRLAVTGDYMAGQLQSRIPSLHYARISLAAGKMPPSIGVIIDRDGDLVSQAQGYNGDHYLPFDLKNLRRLDGGSYVRTRTTGGPTDEDIYTGLMTGARQIQVISHSGVFTVEFDPDTRGSRRYSDKARQMVGRYAEIVKQIGSGTQLQRDISPERRKQLQDRAIERSGKDYGRARELFDEEMRNERQRLAFESDDAVAGEVGRNKARALARQTVAGGGVISNAQLGRDEHELSRASQAQAAKVYRLDGEGYAAALTALQGEFPFYIRSTKFEPWPQFYGERNIAEPDDLSGGMAADIGYTARRGLTPASRERKPVTEAKERPGATETVKGSVAVPTAVDLSTTSLEPDLARALHQSLPLAVANESVAKPIATTDDQALHSEGPIAYAMWASAKGSPKQIAAWLLDPSTDAAHVVKLKEGILDADSEAAADPGFAGTYKQYPGAQRAAELLDQVALLKEPYATDVKGDQVLDISDKPQGFADTSLGSSSDTPYAEYLLNNDGVATAYREIAGNSDEQTADLIGSQIRRYKNLEQWGRELHQDSSVYDDDPPHNFAIDDADEAVAVAREGVDSPAYKDIANLQKAWSIKRGREVVAILRGTKVPSDAGPKAPSNLEEVAKRFGPRVTVHGSQSPLAQAVSKVRASRSRESLNR